MILNKQHGRINGYWREEGNEQLVQQLKKINKAIFILGLRYTYLLLCSTTWNIEHRKILDLNLCIQYVEKQTYWALHLQCNRSMSVNTVIYYKATLFAWSPPSITLDHVRPFDLIKGGHLALSSTKNTKIHPQRFPLFLWGVCKEWGSKKRPGTVRAGNSPWQPPIPFSLGVAKIIFLFIYMGGWIRETSRI